MAYVQNLGSAAHVSSAHTSLVLSPSSKTVTVGNTVTVGFGAWADVTPTGVTDNLGNTYTRVERTRHAGGSATTDFWYAPVTTGGSITTITVSFASTVDGTVMIADEFSALGSSPTAGGGITGASTSPAKWASAVTIPANGAAIGMVSSNGAGAETAGASSGSPSTAITLALFHNAGAEQSGSSAYALAGGTAVTSFDGTTAIASPGTWAAAGAVFAAGAPPVPVIAPVDYSDFPKFLLRRSA